jgi:hypothetical protein
MSISVSIYILDLPGDKTPYNHGKRTGMWKEKTAFHNHFTCRINVQPTIPEKVAKIWVKCFFIFNLFGLPFPKILHISICNSQTGVAKEDSKNLCGCSVTLFLVYLIHTNFFAEKFAWIEYSSVGFRKVRVNFRPTQSKGFG